MTINPVTDPVIAAIDIGTNSTHMVVARIASGGFEVITREKSQTRLGEGGGDMKKLGSAAMDRGVEALGHMKRIADAHQATVVAVATSAVREATNSHQFLRRTAEEAGIEVQVISGLEEARLIHSAVLRALPSKPDPSVLIDIGGGSTEVVVFTGHEEHFARSFKLGAVRLTHRFFPSGQASRQRIAEARRFITSSIEPSRRRITRWKAKDTVVTSGTSETLARMCLLLESNDVPRSMNGATFTRDQLDTVVRRIAECDDVTERGELPGMDPTRADIILAGAIILSELARSLDIDRFTYCDHALREGLLIKELNRLTPGSPDDVRHVAIDSAHKLAMRCDNDFAHALAVSRLSCALFDGLDAHFELDGGDRLLLEAAAVLANVGITISHAKHHVHSYYVIRHGDLLGLTDHEIEIVAQVARYHRKSEPKTAHPEFAALSTPDRYRVRLLSSILRVAIGLDRTHDGRVDRVEVAVDDTNITIKVASPSNQDLELNIYAANERSGLMAEVFRHDVTVTAAPR